MTAALAIAVLAVWPFGSGDGPSVSSALAATLNRLAQVAASGPSLVPRRRQYLFVASAGNQESDAIVNGKECVTHALERRQVWIGADELGLLRESFGRPRSRRRRTGACVTRCRRARSPCPGQATCGSRRTASRSALVTTSMCCRPIRAKLLLQMRRADGGPRSAGEDFVHVGDFLRETDARPALRAALCRAVALIPGVRLLGTVRDHLGRGGLGVAYRTNELIFNPRTAALMAEQTIGDPGWTVYLASRVVNRLPHRSPLPLNPPCVNYGGHVTHTPAGDVQTGAQPN